MLRALEAAANGTLLAQANHPSVRMLEKLAYVVRCEEVKRRVGRIIVYRWETTGDGRNLLTVLRNDEGFRGSCGAHEAERGDN